MKTLIRDQRGVAITQLLGVIMLPIVVIVIAGTIISATRTGSGLMDAFTRLASSQVTLSEFHRTVESATAVSVPAPNKVILTIDPAGLPPGVLNVETTCQVVAWELVDSGELRTLVQGTQVHQSDCSSPVASQRTEELTGLTGQTHFEFQNAAGRSLTFDSGTFTPAPGEAPAGVSANAWASTDASGIVIDGVIQEMFSDHTFRATAVTTPTRPQ